MVGLLLFCSGAGVYKERNGSALIKVKLGARAVQKLCLGLGSWTGGGSGSPAGCLAPTCMRSSAAPWHPRQSSDGGSQLLQHPEEILPCSPVDFPPYPLCAPEHRIISHRLTAARSKEPSIERNVEVGKRFCCLAGEGGRAVSGGNTSSTLADGKSPSSSAAFIIAVVCWVTACVQRGLFGSLRWVTDG